MKKIEYEITHYQYFRFKNSVPDEKRWSFSLKIHSNEKPLFTAFYSKGITECFFHLNSFRKAKIGLDLAPPHFTYQIVENDCRIVEKKAVLTQLKSLQSLENQSLSETLKKELQAELKGLLEDEDELDNELLREIRLIHELEKVPIELGSPQIFSHQIYNAPMDSVKLEDERLAGDEKAFLKQMDWTETGTFCVLKTTLENPTVLKYDRLYGASVLSSKPRKRPSLTKILNRFLQEGLEIWNYEHVSLSRDRRILSAEEHHLSYLLQEMIIRSESLCKESKLEMTVSKVDSISP